MKYFVITNIAAKVSCRSAYAEYELAKSLRCMRRSPSPAFGETEAALVLCQMKAFAVDRKRGDNIAPTTPVLELIEKQPPTNETAAQRTSRGRRRQRVVDACYEYTPVVKRTKAERAIESTISKQKRAEAMRVKRAHAKDVAEKRRIAKRDATRQKRMAAKLQAMQV